MTRKNDPIYILFRFWAKVNPLSNGCWLWTGCRNAEGYARFYLRPNCQIIGAHRFSYEIHKGKIPKGLTIDHLCRNRGCVNPAHMELVSQKENTLRGNGVTALNARKTHCKHGHLFSADNIYSLPYGRHCKQCTKQNAIKRWKRLRAVEGGV